MRDSATDRALAAPVNPAAAAAAAVAAASASAASASAASASASTSAAAVIGQGFGAGLLQHMFDRIDQPVLLLDPRGAVLFRNQAAHLLLSRDDALTLLDTRLAPAQAVDQAGWTVAMRDAASGRQSMLQLHDRAATLLVFVPVPDPAIVRSRTVMLVASRGQGHDTTTLAEFGRLHRLTRTEILILTHLSDGTSAQQIAELRGIAVATIRTHIKNLLHKTGHGGLRQLQATLALLPPVREPAGSTVVQPPRRKAG